MIGIAAGLAMSGLILGALSGSIWFMIGFFMLGFAVAWISEAVKHHKEKTAVTIPYPPYGY